MASTGLETLREVVVRSSQSGRLRVDLALLGRERQQLLAELGLKKAQLIADGALELPEELHAIYEQLRDVEGRIAADSVKAHDNGFGGSRGYEPEAGSFAGDGDSLDEEDDLDEHAEIAQDARKGETR